MAEPGNFAHRVFVEDIRSDGKYLRMTWHPELSGFIVSNWDGDVCVGATRVPVEAAPQLVQLLTTGMADALSAARDEPWTVGPHSAPAAASVAQRMTHLRHKLERLWRRTDHRSTGHDDAEVVDLSAHFARVDDEPRWSSSMGQS
jgi:hypothetical protein